MANQPGTWVRFTDNDGNTGKRRVGKAGTVFQTVYDSTGTNQPPKQQEDKGPGLFGLAASMASARDSDSGSDSEDNKKPSVVKPPLRPDKLKGAFTAASAQELQEIQDRLVKNFAAQRTIARDIEKGGTGHKAEIH